MNETIIKELTKILNIKENQVNAVLKLLSEGATIPFIARYRKEVTGNLNEDEIRAIDETYRYQENLLKKKEDTIRLIDEKGLLTEEIKNSIKEAYKLAEIEDIYRPFKEKKKTKATEAIKAGLEPLAKKIMAFPLKGSMETLASGYNMDVNKAIEGAGYIIAEWISDNASSRKYIRNFIFNTGFLVSNKKKIAKMTKRYMKCIMNFEKKLNMPNIFIS